MLVVYIPVYFILNAATTGVATPVLWPQFIYYFFVSIVLIVLANAAKDVVDRYNAPYTAIHTCNDPSHTHTHTQTDKHTHRHTRFVVTHLFLFESVCMDPSADARWVEHGRAQFLIQLSLARKAKESARIQAESDRLLQAMLPDSIAARYMPLFLLHAN
jgi:hypothetical protein